VALGHGIVQVLTGIELAQVAGAGGWFGPAIVLDGRCRGGEVGGRRGGEHQRRAFTCQGRGDGAADAAASARHHRHFPGKFTRHPQSPFLPTSILIPLPAPACATASLLGDEHQDKS